jgi:hydrogenase-1 operon protein HyaF
MSNRNPTDALDTPARPPQVVLRLSDDEIAGHAEIKSLMLAMSDGLRKICREQAERYWFDASAIDPAVRAWMADLLGRGEVTVKIAGRWPANIHESALLGIWLVDGPGRQGIELAAFPEMAAEAWTRGSLRLDLPAADGLPPGTMNILPVLAEIDHHLGAGDQIIEINLSLLPMTEVDLQVLGRVLGRGEVEICCRGYGSSRTTSCGAGRVWRVQHFNSEERLILDMVQVGGVPAAAQATLEDLADSAARLDELIAAYFA